MDADDDTVFADEDIIGVVEVEDKDEEYLRSGSIRALSMLCLTLDVEGGSTNRSVLLNGFATGVFGLLELDDDDVAVGLAGDGDDRTAVGVDEELAGDDAGLAAATTDALARFIAASAAFFRAAAESANDVEVVVVATGAGAGEALDEEEFEAEALVAPVTHLWFVGKRCSAQNC